MILTGPGMFVFRLEPGASCQTIDWASVSSSEPSFLRAWWKDELVEDIHIGPYGSPHTWWGGNALLGRHGLDEHGVLRIELGKGVKFRIEGDIQEMNSHVNV